MIAFPTKRELTGWRVIPLAIRRVKEAAKRENISANDFVERIILEATKDIETDEEKEERLKSNEDFLTQFAGTWSGQENEQTIMDNIKELRKNKTIFEL